MKLAIFFRLASVGIVIAAASTNVEAATYTIADGTFSNSDWVNQFDGSFGNANSSASQFPAGGNPGQFRNIRHSIGTGGGFTNRASLSWNFNVAQSYSPATEGAIEGIDYSEDSLRVSGNAQLGTFALRQGGLRYRLSTYFDVDDTSNWIQNGFSNLTAADFGLDFFDASSNQFLFLPTANPDFSDSGSLIEFGFQRLESQFNTFGGTTSNGGIDNFLVVVTTANVEVPEPGCMSLVVLSFAAIVFATFRVRTTLAGSLQ